MTIKNDTSDKMTGIPLYIDSTDGHVYRIRCMNCGEAGTFVPTMDYKHLCCVKCTCILADLDGGSVTDMEGIRWVT